MVKRQTVIRVMLSAVVALGLTACSSDTAPATTLPIDPATAGPQLGTLEFQGFELGFQPATLQVKQSGRYAVNFTNTGNIDHDWVVAGTRLLARPGQTVSGEIVVPAEGLEFVCSFPGHAAAGMRGSIVVNDTAGP